MYDVESDQLNMEAGDSGYHIPQQRPVYPKEQPSSRMAPPAFFYRPYPVSPLSAPVTSSTSDDYFSFPGTAINESQLPRQNKPSRINIKQPDAPTQATVNPNVNFLNTHTRSYSSDVRYHSMLSQSFTPNDHTRPEDIRSGLGGAPIMKSVDQLDVASLNMKNRNPGFHLPLDNLNTPHALQRFQPQFQASPHSESSFDVTYDKMLFTEPDSFFHTGAGGNFDSGQEDVTPLMNPPNMNENGYFGGLESSLVGNNDLTDLFMDNTLNGGYLNDLPSKTGSQPMDEFNNYVNFRMMGGSLDDNTKSDGINPVTEAIQIFDHKDEGSDGDSFVLPSMQLHLQSEHILPNAFRPLMGRSASVPGTSGALPLARSADKKAVSGKKKKALKGSVCTICDRFISRDFSRHMRIHDEVGRFQCVFPRSVCKHRSGKFNRPYDYKKHLLNVHFKYDDPAVKLAPNLTDKLLVSGQCIACGQKFMANYWLEHHILTTDTSMMCPELRKLEKLNGEASASNQLDGHEEVRSTSS